MIDASANSSILEPVNADPRTQALIELSTDLFGKLSRMNIVLITQDDPFYLAEELDFLLRRIPSGCAVKASVIASASPFGRKEGLVVKARRTVEIFGLRFFVRYAVRFAAVRLKGTKSVKSVLRQHGVELVELQGSINSPESLETIADYRPDLLISIAGNEIFRRPLIDLAKYGCLNLHSALLPKYRGLLPSFWVLKNRESETGVSVFFVDEGIDSGPIHVQKKIAIDDMSQEQLIKRTKRLGMEAIIASIRRIRDGDMRTVENPDSEATYFSFPSREDVRQFRRAGARFY